MLTSTTPAAARRVPRWLGPALAVASALLVAVPVAFGPLSLPAILLLAPLALAAAVWLVVAVPQGLVVLVPGALPAPMMNYTYAWELLLWLLVALVLAWGWQRRARWLARVSPLEVAFFAFAAWALFSAFWSHDARNYLIQARRILLGAGALWVALRLRFVAPLAWFERGILLATCTLGAAALAKRLSSGLSEAQAAMRRPEVTNLGWGTANFIATLLLLMTPVIVSIALHQRGRMRLVAWATWALAAVMQVVIASRAAEVLFVLGTIVQVMSSRARRAPLAALVVVVTLGGLLASPLGGAFFERFTDLREMGSMTIRIWFQREGWRRMLAHLPLGLGLGQGYSNPDKLQGEDPHNYWLVVGGDLGLPGLALWALVLVLVWRGLGRMARSPGWRATADALRISFVLGQLHTLVEPTYQGVQYQFIFFWVFGGFLGYHAAVEDEARAPAVAAGPSAQAAAPAAASSRR